MQLPPSATQVSLGRIHKLRMSSASSIQANLLQSTSSGELRHDVPVLRYEQIAELKRSRAIGAGELNCCFFGIIRLSVE